MKQYTKTPTCKVAIIEGQECYRTYHEQLVLDDIEPIKYCPNLFRFMICDNETELIQKQKHRKSNPSNSSSAQLFAAIA